MTSRIANNARLLTLLCGAAATLACPAAIATAAEQPSDQPTDRPTPRQNTGRVVTPDEIPPALLEAAQANLQPAEAQPAQPAPIPVEAAPPIRVGDEAPNLRDLEGTLSFAAFSEAVELSAIVEFIAASLEINVIAPPTGVPGSVVFNAPVEVPRAKLLDVLASLLELQDHAITYDSTSGFYVIAPRNAIQREFLDDLETVKVISVPFFAPSRLQEVITAMVTGQSGTVNFIDELGLIIIADTARNIARIEQAISIVLERYQSLPLHTIELEYVSAPIALERIVAIAGGGSASIGRGARTVIPGQNQQGGGAAAGGSAGGLESLAERLSVAPQGNALLFRGSAAEIDKVLEYVEIIDQPNPLTAQQYFVGRFARQIALFARQRGFGEVVELDDQSAGVGGFGNNNFAAQNRFQQPGTANQFGSPFGQQTQQQIGGPTMIVDVREGTIVYYGTPSQQASLDEIIAAFPTEDDVQVIRAYRLNNAAAEDVAQIVDGILRGQLPQGTGSTLLPQSQGFQQPIIGGQQRDQTGAFSGQPLAEGEIGGFFDPEESFVIADPANNQVFVKAPRKQQNDFEQLISKLDLRRAQVYVEATILSISDTENFRLAVESQLDVGSAQFRFNNFGLSEAQTSLSDNLVPATGLNGLTAAVLLSQFTPAVINAIKNTTDARILSRPSLLVNDNEEAEIVSLEQQPVASTSQGDNSTITSFGGFEDAGTTLTVTPTISEAGFIRLDYAVELSSFTGVATDTLPPPRANNNVRGLVTIPTDSTIVVGGITVENAQETIAKIPLLGDIPLIGLLFSDTNTSSSNSILYIFITPRIMTDPNFADLKLLTEGPQAYLNEGEKVSRPKVEPLMMRFLDQGPVRTGDLPDANDGEPWQPTIPAGTRND